MAFDQPARSERRKKTDRRVAPRLHNISAIDRIAITILIIGGINWGLIGLMNIDLVNFLLGEMTGLVRAVHVLVGLSAFYNIYFMVRITSNINRRKSQL